MQNDAALLDSVQRVADEIRDRADVLLCIGIVMVGSASIAIAEGNGVSPHYYLARHLVFICIGVTLASLSGALAVLSVFALSPLGAFSAPADSVFGWPCAPSRR